MHPFYSFGCRVAQHLIPPSCRNSAWCFAPSLLLHLFGLFVALPGALAYPMDCCCVLCCLLSCHCLLCAYTSRLSFIIVLGLVCCCSCRRIHPTHHLLSQGVALRKEGDRIKTDWSSSCVVRCVPKAVQILRLHMFNFVPTYKVRPAGANLRLLKGWKFLF
jgi:hypothetical protein